MRNAHHIVVRPWGRYVVLEKKAGYWIKKLFVRKGAMLSLQRHRDRREVWIVLSGKVRVTTGNTRKTLETGACVQIAKREKHRITGLQPSWILEAAFGRARERDIVRLDDLYGRIKHQRDYPAKRGDAASAMNSRGSTRMP